MKIALNATCFNDRPSGAKQRFLGIYGDLIHRLPEAEFVVFAPADCDMESWFSNAQNVRIRKTSIPSEGRWAKLLFSYTYWKRALSVEKYDIFEGFHLPQPKVASSKSILTLHDIRRLNGEYGWLERSTFRETLKHSLRNIDLVVTVSQSMLNEILPYCPNTPIRVVPNGIDISFYRTRPSEDELLAFRDKYSLPHTFMLSVGHLEKRKNYVKLIEAIASLAKRGRNYNLIIIGNDNGYRSVINTQIAKYNLENRIKILSGLSDNELRCAYWLCQLFVFPSVYEGFGIPVLEAMAVGRPLALSNIAVFREITEDQGAYFDPTDPEKMAFVIDRVFNSEEEQLKIIDYGQSRVAYFDYSEIGLQYQQLYSSLIG
jgi:glycosyltransferase involved in cell wall biosynthesis